MSNNRLSNKGFDSIFKKTNPKNLPEKFNLSFNKLKSVEELCYCIDSGMTKIEILNLEGN